MITSIIMCDNKQKTYQLLLRKLEPTELPVPEKKYLYKSNIPDLNDHKGIDYGDFKISRSAYKISEILRKKNIDELYLEIWDLIDSLKNFNDPFTEKLKDVLNNYQNSFSYTEFRDGLESLPKSPKAMRNIWDVETRIKYLQLIYPD